MTTQWCKSRKISGSSHPLLHRKVGQERTNFLFTHIPGIALGVKNNEPPDPVNIGLLSFDAVMLHANYFMLPFK
jgi:hypothetical protein